MQSMPFIQDSPSTQVDQKFNFDPADLPQQLVIAKRRQKKMDEKVEMLIQKLKQHDESLKLNASALQTEGSAQPSSLTD